MPLIAALAAASNGNAWLLYDVHVNEVHLSTSNTHVPHAASGTDCCFGQQSRRSLAVVHIHDVDTAIASRHHKATHALPFTWVSSCAFFLRFQ
jgi:hypothetical protein